MTVIRRTIHVLMLSVALLGGTGSVARAVEGGLPAYLLGSRESLAGIVPEPGTYAGLDVITFSGDVTGVSLAGLPIRAKTDLDVDLVKLTVTQVFKSALWGGTPAVNINVPYVIDAELRFTGELPPIEGASIRDTTDGIGDIAITPLVGWHEGYLHYNAALTVFAPTGDYDTATVSTNPPNVQALNTGKNVWSIQPVFSATYLNTENGRELSGAASFLFSEKNDATDYQTAPAVTIESAAMQHLPSGWALGLMGYWYQQLGDDSGSGADATKLILNADSLEARVFGIGPLITYNGKLLGRDTSVRFKYISEFEAKRRFENDVLWLNATMTF